MYVSAIDRRTALRAMAAMAAAPLLARCGVDALGPSDAVRIDRATGRLVMSPTRIQLLGDPHFEKLTNVTAYRIADQAKARALNDPTMLTVYLGDIVVDGTAAQYRDYATVALGSWKNRIWFIPGNHDYNAGRKAGLLEAQQALPYFDFCGEQAGPRGKGYYGKTVGAYRLLFLNSQALLAEQQTWLASELAQWAASHHILAFIHQPYMSAPCNHAGVKMTMNWPGTAGIGRFWVLLERYKAEALISGHCHTHQVYPRMRRDPNNPYTGIVDSVNGVRQFVFGTGGTPTMPFWNPAAPHPRVSKALTGYRGITELTLESDRYSWRFTDTSGVVRDSGTQVCRAKAA
jgi:acid phosphatase type 7